MVHLSLHILFLYIMIHEKGRDYAELHDNLVIYVIHNVRLPSKQYVISPLNYELLQNIARYSNTLYGHASRAIIEEKSNITFWILLWLSYG